MSTTETTKLWPKLVHSYADMPEDFLPLYKECTDGMNELPYTVFTPGVDPLNAGVIFMIGEILYVFKKSKNGAIAYLFNISEINYIEVTSILLLTCLKINGYFDGKPCCVQLEYNSVCEHYLAPILKKLRVKPNDKIMLNKEKNSDSIYRPNGLDIKFTNFLNSMMNESLCVRDILYQAQQVYENKTFFGKQVRDQRLMAHLSVLTDEEIIIVREPDLIGAAGKFGVIATYIPINRIKELVTEYNNSNTITMNIMLQDSDVLKNMYSISNEERVERYKLHFKHLRTA